ncbi:MAG: hypothetical protein JO246_06955 [Frankiaceae bacterium]|nr:hypothetical protein [Frankiaceae bacterium]
MAAAAQRGFDPGILRDAVTVADEAGCDELFLVPTSDDVGLIERVAGVLDL